MSSLSTNPTAGTTAPLTTGRSTNPSTNAAPLDHRGDPSAVGALPGASLLGDSSLTASTATAPARTALSGLVGNTPVLRISAPFTPSDRGFWAKLEGFNPGGIKDRPGLHMVERARARGELKPGARIIESTSGTLGLGLALAGMVYGHPVTLVTDPGLERSMTRLLTAYGAQVNVVSDPHPTGGWQQARRDRVTRLMDRHPDSWCPDQYNNPDNTTAYTPSPWNSRPSWDTSTSSCAAWARAATRPAYPGCCVSSTPSYASSESTPSVPRSSANPPAPG